MANWLWTLEVPLFVSHRRLMKIKNYHPATCDWALDSGAFTELSTYGEWRTISARGYAQAVRRYAQEIGRLAWVSPMDWMCEDFVLKMTGSTVRNHQNRTVRSVVTLRSLIDDVPVIPVIQGFTDADYMRCVELYDRAGIDLTAEPLVGLGSVCRRENTDEIGRVVKMLHDVGISLHGYGVKEQGITKYGTFLTSSDSMAWSFVARRRQIKLPECSHVRCQNCPVFAQKWRKDLLQKMKMPV